VMSAVILHQCFRDLYPSVEGLLLPMALYVMPLISDLIPVIRNEVATALGNPSSRCPMKKAAIPIPIARRPHIPVSVRRLVFDTGWGRRRIAYDVRGGAGGQQPSLRHEQYYR
jgi:hypothetical protein